MRRQFHIFKKQEEAGDEELPTGITFLNSLKPAQVLKFYEEMIHHMKFFERTNLRHIFSPH